MRISVAVALESQVRQNHFYKLTIEKFQISNIRLSYDGGREVTVTRKFNQTNPLIYTTDVYFLLCLHKL